MKVATILCFVIIIFLFSSCGKFVYKSVSVKTPLFNDKNDFVGQLSVGGAGGEIYAAYAPINYLGASLSYAGGSFNKDTSNSNSTYKFRDFEWSLIPFYSRENVRLEIPIGMGYTTQTTSTSIVSSPYTRSFLQPTVGICIDYFDFAFFCRFTQLAYMKPAWGTDQRYEPGIMVRGGSKNIKGMIQFRLDYGTNYSRTSGLSIFDQVEYLPFHLTLGAVFAINFNKTQNTK